MFKSAVVLCLACFVVIEARPKWQFLPSVPGYVPVYIQTGDTPLDMIHPELAAAFHALPEGRSASKQIEASSDEQPEPVLVESAETVEEAKPAVKAEETAVKADEPAVKAEEPAVNVLVPAVKAEEPAVKADEPEEESAVVETTKVVEKKVSSEVAKPEYR